MIIFITYIVCELKGKNRPTRARVALIMCLIVTVFQVVSIFGTNIGMKEMYADVIGMEVDELRVEDFQTDSTLDTGEIFGSLDIDEGTEIDDEDVYEVFGIDPDDIEDDEDAVEAGKKMLSKLYIPGIYQYIIIAVSILGIILIRKKKN